MKISKTKALLLSLVLIGGVAIAATFNDADKDDDEMLTIAELKAAGMDDYVAKFSALDTNKDGKLSKAEAKANR